MKSTSLRTRLTITFAVSTISLAGIHALVIGHRSTQNLRTQIGSSLAGTACQMGVQLDRDLASRPQEVALLAGTVLKEGTLDSK